MKQIKYIAFSLLVFGLFFTSCTPENIDVEDVEIVVQDKTENNLVTRSNTTTENGVLLACLTIDFPFFVTTVNGETIEILDADDFEFAFSDTSNYIVDFIYPLSITQEDGTSSTTNSIDELGELFASCIPDDGWNNAGFPAFLIDDEYCINLLYPYNVTDLNDNIYEVDTEEIFVDLLATYGILYYEYPLIVVDNTTGAEQSVIDEADLFEALFSCDNANQPSDSIIWGGSLACYDIVFPLSVILDDGSIVEVSTEEELTILQLDQNVVNLSYPITLEDPTNGTVFLVNDSNELGDYLLICVEMNGFGIAINDVLNNIGDCFELVFPVTVLNQNGDSFNVNTMQELESYSGQNVALLAPLTFVFDDGTTFILTIDTLFDFLELADNC